MKQVNKVSILMGIYNCSKTLPEAIDSIVNQTYENWQLIMCDDGSSDNTLEIANDYKAKFPEKIVVIHNEQNMGLNFTLNHCLEYATGEYIARMDGDDISLPKRFEKEIAFLQKHSEYAIVSTPIKYFDEDGIFNIGTQNGEPDVNKMAIGTPFCHAPCMVRKEAFDAVNGYSVDEKLLRVEDWHLWIKMYAKGYKGYNIPEPLYMMRDDRNAVNRRKFRYRLNEARVSVYATKALNLSKKNYIYALRPIIVGLMPRFIYNYFHTRKVIS